MLLSLFSFLTILSLLRVFFTWRRQLRFWQKMAAGAGAERDAAASHRPAAILAPVKGIDPDFPETLRSLLSQNYPAPYDLLLSLESKDDPAIALIEELVRESEQAGELHARSVDCIIAGLCHDRGQKVHNLSVAAQKLATDTEVICFIDSDARPSREWLAELTAPLAQPEVGASTGFRWYLPVDDGFVSSLACLWNSMALGLVARENNNFAWGGSMAIRRLIFDGRSVIDHYWKGSVSDDGGLTAAVHEAGLRIAFVPNCILPSLHTFRWEGLWEFVTRQFIITRIYIPQLYRFAIIASGLDILGFFGSLIFATIEILLGHTPIVLCLLLASVYALTVATGIVRYKGSRIFFADHAEAVRKTRNVLVFGTPLAWLLNFCSLCVAWRRRTILWRGIRYEILGRGRLTIKHK